MSHISCNKPVLMLLVLLTAVSCCKKGKETITEERAVIVLGNPSISGTKAAIDHLDDLKASNLQIGVYGYKTQPVDQTFNFYRLFNNTPVTYSQNDEIWSYTPTRYWDSNPVVTYQFFAYWPHLASSDSGDGLPWVDANDVNNLTSTENMRVTIHDIPNWQDAADSDTRDYLTSVRTGQYRTDGQEPPLFYGGIVNFNFSHILSKLIIRGYYVGDQNNQVKVHNITVSGAGILSANGTSDYQSKISNSDRRFTQIGKATAQQNVEQELYDDNQGCLILQNAFKANDEAQYTPTPVCEWLVVPTDGWTNLTLSVTYAIGSAQPQTSDITNVVLGTGDDHLMESGKTYMLDLKFNTEGGVELKTMLISEWVDVNVTREIYNW